MQPTIENLIRAIELNAVAHRAASLSYHAACGRVAAAVAAKSAAQADANVAAAELLRINDASAEARRLLLERIAEGSR